VLADAYDPKTAFWLGVLGGGAAVVAVVLRRHGLHPPPDSARVAD
jgi:hypothetical protein